MKIEERQLLLRDLCMRLPYGVMIQHPELLYPSRMVVEKLMCTDGEHINDEKGISIEYVKPYLRPMSSMTSEELSEVTAIFKSGLDTLEEFVEYIDWLNKNHFDYRGLIEKGLAIEAPKNMYKNNSNSVWHDCCIKK